MIVRGRPSTTVILEINGYLYGIFGLTAGAKLAALSSVLTSLTELLFGPAVGIGLILLWGYVSKKLYALAYAKFFNCRN